MATGGLYGNASESVGLYGNTTNFGGSYFEWFIFYQSDTQPATPTGGSWSFTTNTGTPPTGWSVVPFPAPTLPVWVSIALVNSRSDVPLVWSAPGLFSYSSGLPILSGSGTPAVGDGINSQLYVQTSTTPQTIWFKQSGTWNRLVGSTLYADLTSAQTVAGIKTFSSPIVGSVTGTSANVTGIVDIANGGTSSTTANGAFNALAPSQTSQAGKYLTTDGTNASWGTNPLGTVTSVDVSGGTTGLTTSGGPVTTSGTITLAGTLAVANGGTGATTTGVALTNLGAVGTIASADASIVVTRVGSSVDLSVSTTSPASVLLEQVRNTTGATLTKGTAVYISGATGQIPTVSKALATSDATSAQTLGLITSNLANNSNGYVTIIGLISDLDTSAYTDGQQLYLSPITAGTLTATKPYAPQHLVYMAVVAHAHPTQGKLLVKVQNGYELDELHNVAAQSPTTGQTIVWNSATSLWEKNTVSLTVGVNGTLPIANGGTGQATANAAFNALAPSQTGNSGKYLTTDGTDTSWASNPLGTVTSVSGAGTVNGLTLTGTVTTSGSLTLGGTLSGVANSALTNSSITIGGTTIALGGSSNALANDITVYGVTVGRGAGAVATNTAVGNGALTDGSVGVGNTAIGYQALKVNQTNNNTAVGNQSMVGTTTGAANTALGVVSFFTNTTGSNSVALGFASLYSNTTGSFNVAIGRDSLGNNTTASNNTAVGYQAGYSNTTSQYNTYIGHQAGYSVTTTANTGFNTFVGYQAGYSTTGDVNTFIGQGAGSSVTSGRASTIIGRYNGNQGGLDIRTLSNYIVLSDGDGNPRGYFDVNGNFNVGVTAFAGRIVSTYPNSVYGIVSSCTSTSGTAFYHRFLYNGTETGTITSTGTLTVYNTTSDYRAKNITGSLTGYKERLMSLQPKQGTWIADGSEFRGFLAHEFATPYRASVTGEKDAIDENGNPKMQSMQASTSEVMADLVALVQEQQAIIESLKARLDAANL